MNVRNAILLTLIAMSAAAGFGQEVESPEEYRFYVPLPESTFRGGWHFRLELGALENKAYQVSLLGFNPIGIPVLNEAPRLIGGDEIFTWQDVASYTAFRLQTLIVITDRPVSGVLWMWDDVYSFINGVNLTTEASESLILPHIPNDLFSWRTTFVVQGVAKGAPFGDIDFQYYDEKGTRYTYLAQNRVSANARITGTPGHDIPLSELGQDTRAPWGRVTTHAEGFQVAGYLNYLRNAEVVQSCALELSGKGSPTGYLGLSKHENYVFSEGMAFTNPNDEAVNLHLYLTVERPIEMVEGDGEKPVDPEQPTTEIVVFEETVELGPRQRVIHALGTTLFKDLEGDFQILRYRALSVNEYPVEDEEGAFAPKLLSVAAIHLQGAVQVDVGKAASGEVSPLGGHGFVPTIGNTSLAWLNLGDEFETMIEVFNPGLVPSTLNIIFKDALGNPLYILEDLVLNPGMGFHELRSDLLRDELLAMNEDLPADAVLRVEFKRKSGSGFFTKTTTFRGKDFAVINPAVWTIPDDGIEF
jgi:hypothetical protein